MTWTYMKPYIAFPPVSGFPDFLPAVGKPAAGSRRNGRNRRLLDFVELHQWVDGGIDVNDEHNSRCTHHFQHFSFLGADVWGWYPFSLKNSECLRKNKHLIFAINGLEDEFISFWCVFFCCFSGGSVRITHTHTCMGVFEQNYRPAFERTSIYGPFPKIGCFPKNGWWKLWKNSIF